MAGDVAGAAVFAVVDADDVGYDAFAQAPTGGDVAAADGGLAAVSGEPCSGCTVGVRRECGEN